MFMEAVVAETEMVPRGMQSVWVRTLKKQKKKETR
jgi:hypothetical protein